MAHAKPAKITSPILTLKDDYVKLVPIGLIVGAIGLGVAFFASGLDFVRFSHSYLTAYMAALSMCVGCLFFVTVMHLTRAGWCVTVRRIAEIYAMCLPIMFLLFLPILLPVLTGSDAVYPWNQDGWSVHGDKAAVAAELEKGALLENGQRALPPLEALKKTFLNKGFFGIRIVAYFAIWSFMAWFFFSNSRKQDETGEGKLSLRMQAFSAPGMIVFAATLVFASFDMEMSLEPLWFSTMFPVYWFAGAMLSALATISLTAMLLQRSGRVTDEITVEHYHDLAKLMFAFVFFWGYIGFSQFMLIWYANIPEETFWFDWRINRDGWMTVSLVLLVGHLIIPFLGIMARTVRRSRSFMFFASIYLLVMHFIDHYWLVMPQANADHSHSANLIPDIGCAIGMAGLMVAIFLLVARDTPLVPLKDPRLGEALNFHNP